MEEKITPETVIISGIIFWFKIKNGSDKGENIIQFMMAPINTAIDVRIIIGEVIFFFSSLIGRRGEDMDGDHTSIINIRAEYEAVNSVAIINIIKISGFVGLYKIISRIMSLE